jgi:cyclase
MLNPRIIPCLLIQNNGLVKTTKFSDPKYVGDPLNAVKIFNDKEADELIVLDICASKENKEPNYELIENLASECRMPLCYGGGVNNLEQALKIFSLGVEKIAISTAAINDISIIAEIASRVGSQSVVVVLDVKKKLFSNKYEVYYKNGSKSTGYDLIDFVTKIVKEGAGEIVLNSIDLDGTMKGYDLNLLKVVQEAVDIPITILGGAGKIEDLEEVIRKFGIIGLAAGSMFVFKGRFRAVLINYPTPEEKIEIIKNSKNIPEKSI